VQAPVKSSLREQAQHHRYSPSPSPIIRTCRCRYNVLARNSIRTTYRVSSDWWNCDLLSHTWQSSL
jgi:hypothetical protein